MSNNGNIFLRLAVLKGNFHLKTWVTKLKSIAKNYPVFRVHPLPSENWSLKVTRDKYFSSWTLFWKRVVQFALVSQHFDQIGLYFLDVSDNFRYLPKIVWNIHVKKSKVGGFGGGGLFETFTKNLKSLIPKYVPLQRYWRIVGGGRCGWGGVGKGVWNYHPFQVYRKFWAADVLILETSQVWTHCW